MVRSNKPTRRPIVHLKSKLTLAAAGLLALGGAGTGVALASPGAAGAAPAHTVRVVSAQLAPQAPSALGAAAAPAVPSPAPADGDTVQSGDQTTPDSPNATAAEATTAGASEATAPETDGPGGHQDPPGANIDHQSTTEQ
jgi:hypothetical protein